MFETLDQKIRKLGYVKVSDNEYGIRYHKQEKGKYIHAVDIMHKQNGKVLLYSYDASNDALTQVALEEDEIRLFLKKLRQIKKRYK